MHGTLEGAASGQTYNTAAKARSLADRDATGNKLQAVLARIASLVTYERRDLGIKSRKDEPVSAQLHSALILSATKAEGRTRA